jgi:hypothetical protein
VADAFRQEWGRITAALIHQTGDWDLATAVDARQPQPQHSSL